MPKGIFSLFRRKPVFERSAARHACRIDGVLTLTDSGVDFDGRVINLSLGGAMFRPPLAHLMNRPITPISLTLGELTIAGELVATTPQGFGLRFEQLLTEAQLQKLLDEAEARLRRAA